MVAQLTELPRKPHPSLMDKVFNAPTVRDKEMRELLQAARNGAISHDEYSQQSGYTGNKPSGGLWTSTYTPHDTHQSDWLTGIRTPGTLTSVSAILRSRERRRLFVLDVSPAARVLEIGTLADAIAFTQDYRLDMVPAIREVSPIMTGEVTDWASVPFDAIHVSADVVDQIVYGIHHGDEVDTSFHTWTAESSLWLRWRFSRVHELPT